MITTLRLDRREDRQRVRELLDRLRLNPAEIALGRAEDDAAVRSILSDVAVRGDEAVVELARRYDDPRFSADRIRVTGAELAAAAGRVGADLTAALRRSIEQVRQYQAHVMPSAPAPLQRPGVWLGMRFTPLDSAGLYVPGGKAAYPSTLIMLATPAQVAGVGRIVVCTPPDREGRGDLVFAACHALGLTEVFRAGGAAAIGAMAFGGGTIPRVDKIVGPGNRYVQLAKRAVAGCVGIDGFLGPSEILTLADESGNAAFIAADLIAQAEHDPGSCFLFTTSPELARAVEAEVGAQADRLDRSDAIRLALQTRSAIVVGESMDELIDLANEFAVEHLNLQTRDDEAVLARLRHGGAIFLGAYSAVAAGDYVAGPSHCLPTNTTARFSSGISVYEFLKRASVERYDAQGLAADAPAIIALAEAEGLTGHAASVRVRKPSA